MTVASPNTGPPRNPRGYILSRNFSLVESKTSSLLLVVIYKAAKESFFMPKTQKFTTFFPPLDF